MQDEVKYVRLNSILISKNEPVPLAYFHTSSFVPSTVNLSHLASRLLPMNSRHSVHRGKRPRVSLIDLQLAVDHHIVARTQVA